MMPDYEVIDAHTMEQTLEREDAAVVNVLAEEEFEKAHIPGTINIPENDASFASTFDARVPDLETPVVVYCASKQCDASPRAAHKLVQMGYKHVYDFEGGMKAWLETGHKLERPS